jgi:hypothetical protein
MVECFWTIREVGRDANRRSSKPVVHPVLPDPQFRRALYKLDPVLFRRFTNGEVWL